MARLKPRHLIVRLLQAEPGRAISVQEAIAAGALFGIQANSIRVAISRLSADGHIASADRGLYTLGPNAARRAETLSRWRQSLDRLAPWHGTWFGVHCGALGRADRNAVRHRERALELAGCRTLAPGLLVRPANLAGGVDAFRDWLAELGLEAAAVVCELSGLSREDDGRARGLWPTEALDAGYRKTAEQLHGWLQRHQQLDADVAARESFVIGDAAIRQLLFDPLLPAQWLDHAARKRFFDLLLAFDDAGHDIWRSLYQQVSRDGAGSRASVH